MKKESIYKLLQFKEVEIIGSSANERLIYPSDIDMEEKIITKKDYQDIYNFFLNIYTTAKENKNIYIIDFKLGHYKGVPLKWEYKDIINKYVVKDDLKITFDYALNQNSTIKIDVIFFVKNVAHEASVNYYFIFPKKNHQNVLDTSDETMYKKLLYEARLLFKSGNDYKALKRIYTYYYELGKDKDKIYRFEELFNSPLGNLNKQKAGLETIVLLLENTFREVPRELIIDNLIRIREQLPKKYHKQMDNIINGSKKIMIRNINKLVDVIVKDINKKSREWKEQNKDLLFLSK